MNYFTKMTTEILQQSSEEQVKNKTKARMTVKCQTQAKNQLNATKMETINQEPNVWQQIRQETTKKYDI